MFLLSIAGEQIGGCRACEIHFQSILINTLFFLSVLKWTILKDCTNKILHFMQAEQVITLCNACLRAQVPIPQILMSLCKCWVQGKKPQHPLKIYPFRPNSVLENAHRIPIDFDGLCINTFERRISSLEFSFFSAVSCLALMFLFSLGLANQNIPALLH